MKFEYNLLWHKYFTNEKKKNWLSSSEKKKFPKSSAVSELKTQQDQGCFCYRVKVNGREVDPMTEVESACFRGNQYLEWGYRCYFLSWINSHLSNTDKCNSFSIKTMLLKIPILSP